MLKKIIFFYTLTIFLCVSKSYAQWKYPAIQLSGVVVSEIDSLQPIPFANVYVKGTKRGTVCNANGFFSLVIIEGDVVRFSSMGFKETVLKLPKKLDSDVFTIIQALSEKNIELKPIVIRPYPSPEKFGEAFVKTPIPDDDMRRAERNLEPAKLQALSEVMAMDGNENYDVATRQFMSKLYYNGQQAPNNLLNPFAWANFIQALKRGDFKKKKKPYNPND